MSEQTDSIINKLQQFGLDQDDASIYLYLSAKGPSTALKISRDLHLGRTKVYRKLDILYAKKLILQNVQDRGFEFEAAPAKNLSFLLEAKRNELTTLDSLYSQLTTELSNIENSAEQSGNIKYYKGISGLEQVTWNSLKAEKELLIYEMVQDMSQFLSKEFAEKYRTECVKRCVHTKQITNLKVIKPYTHVSSYVQKYWHLKHVNPTVLKISYEVLIYNDVVAQYSMRGKDIFCVEIRDKRLADMQKDIFRFVWGNALPMKIKNSTGAAHL